MVECKYISLFSIMLTLVYGEVISNSTGKAFNVLNVVEFPNERCTMGSGKDGVCYSSTECASLGGTGQGMCANGFGVCCYFEATCGGTTSLNNTYFKMNNQEFSPCTLDICKMQEDICQIRLDFHEFNLDGPETSYGTDKSTVTQCQKSEFSVTGDGKNSPVICGKNTGYHMIVEALDTCNQLRTFFTSDSVLRALEIQISQIACNAPWKAPEGCTQWFTGNSGTVYSYNYQGGLHVEEQEYVNCIRREEGKCSMATWAESTEFKISGTGSTSSTDDDCVTDYVYVPRARTSLTILKNVDRICGTLYGFGSQQTLYTDRYPFIIGVSFNTAEAYSPAETGTLGFKINYEQGIACGTQ